MGKRTAINLVRLGGIVVTVLAILGLRALGANESIVVLGFILPLIGGSYLVSRIVMHYGADHPKR